MLNAAEIAELTAGFSPEQRRLALTMLNEGDHRDSRADRYRDPADLMASCDPRFKITPAIRLIATEIEKTIDTPGRNLLITAPPQEGKSMLTCIGAPARTLQKYPDRRVILAMYGDDLAHEHGGRCRDLFARYGTGAVDPLTGRAMQDRLGVGLDPSYGSAGKWRIKGHDGGMVSAGLGSGITGRPADLFIVDDPYKVAGEADSESYRRKIEAFFNSVVYLRLGPGANIILILTRWHDQDIAGKIMRDEAELPELQRTWHHVNIPAIATLGVPDALGREPGEYLVSARGRQPVEFDATRRKIGERTFWSMYQGVPKPPGGSLFQTAWTEACALDFAPPPMGGVVGVDPAETAKSDEAGLVAAYRAGDATIITHDWSALMTSDQWSRKAVLLAILTNAREIVFEGYTAHVTYAAVLRTAIRHVAEEAAHAPGHILDGIDCTSFVRGARPRVRHWRVKGDAVMRSAALRQACETGSVRLAPGLDDLVEAMTGWQPGQHCPDRVAAAVIAYDAATPKNGRTGHAELAAPPTSGTGTTTAATPRRGGSWGRAIG